MDWIEYELNSRLIFKLLVHSRRFSWRNQILCNYIVCMKFQLEVEYDHVTHASYAFGWQNHAWPPWAALLPFTKVTKCWNAAFRV